MGRLIYLLAGVSVLMVILAGAGAFLISSAIIAQSKVDAVSTTAKGISLALSEQVILLDSVLDAVAQDPDLISAISRNDLQSADAITEKLKHLIPGAMTVKLLLYDEKDPNLTPRIPMGFADLDMARKTFETNQPTAIQGDIGKDRHLAIARRIMLNDAAIGVILVGLKYDFISRIVSASPLEKGRIELRQGKLVLASTGDDDKEIDLNDNPAIRVPYTEWEIYYNNDNPTTIIEFSLIVGIVLIPALIVALGFATGIRKLTDALSDDLAWVLKAFKDLMTEKPMGEYPVNYDEVKHLISKLSQFKKLVKEKWFDI